MEPKFTPGPWRIERGPWKTRVSIKTDEGEQVFDASVYCDVHEYNAQLAVAAPEMYELLCEVEPAYDEEDDIYQNTRMLALIRKIQALRAKINGEPT